MDISFVRTWENCAFLQPLSMVKLSDPDIGDEYQYVHFSLGAVLPLLGAEMREDDLARKPASSFQSRVNTNEAAMSRV